MGVMHTTGRTQPTRRRLLRGREGEYRTRETRQHRAGSAAATGSLPGLLPRQPARPRKVIAGLISARLHPPQGALLPGWGRLCWGSRRQGGDGRGVPRHRGGRPLTIAYHLTHDQKEIPDGRSNYIAREVGFDGGRRNRFYCKIIVGFNGD